MDPRAGAPLPQGVAQAKLSDRAARLIANRETPADVGRALDLVGECNCEGLNGNPAFPVFRSQTRSVPSRNWAQRSPAANGTEGDRKVQFSSFSRQVEAAPFST